MSIEKSPASTANPKAAARSDSSHGVKSKAGGSDAAAEGAGTGFMAILGALGDAPADAPLSASGSAGTGDALLADPGNAAPAFDASLLLQQNPQIAAAQALQAAAAAALAAGQAGQTSQTGTATASNALTGIGMAGAATALAGSAAGASFATASKNQASLLQGGTASLLPAGAQAAQAAADPAKPGQELTGQDLPGQAARRAAPAAAGAAGKDAGTSLSAASGTAAPAESLTQGLQHASAHARAAREALQAGADNSNGAATGSASTAATGNERSAADKFMAALEQGRAPQGERGLEPLLAPLQPKQEKAQGERAGFSFKSAEPTYAGSTLGVSAPDFSQSGAPAPVMAPEMQVAEQVSYWVSHNVQNAELKLDGLGDSPVQVNISVQGNEAQIVFRTDEAATRSMLEGAGSHLKDMLQREGVLLTGVSVGSSGGSGHGEAGGGERRARQNARQGVIAPLQVASADGGPRLRTDAGRAVDLFV